MIYTTLIMKPGMLVPEEKKVDFKGYQTFDDILFSNNYDLFGVLIDGHHYFMMAMEQQQIKELPVEEHEISDLPLTLALGRNNYVVKVLTGGLIFFTTNNLNEILSLNISDIKRIKEYFSNNHLRYCNGRISLPVCDITHSTQIPEF